MTAQSTALRFADTVARRPFTELGFYPRYAVTDDGGTLCPDCCQAERLQIATSFAGDGWRVVAIEAHLDDSESLFCSHCGDEI